MSYSRWSQTSIWYTYYACSYSIERDEQAFDVCGVKCFLYKDLKTNLEDCLAQAKAGCPDATEEDMKDLRGYIKRFMEEVESDIALNLVEQIKVSDLKDLPDLAIKLKSQTEECYNKEDFEEFLKDLDLIIDTPETQIASIAESIKTDLGKKIYQKKLNSPKIDNLNRYEILKT